MNRTNVVNKPTNDYNACDDFFVLVVTCHIIAAALTFLKMKSLNDVPSEDILPNAHSLWMQSAEERKAVLDRICKQLVDSFVDFTFNEEGSSMHSEADKLNEYGKQLLSVGFFYLEFADSIREGDGECVLRCWRFLLPIFQSSGRTNYSCEVLNMLFQQSYALSPRLSAELIWSRFVNVHGHPGKNIPLDLHMEHLNRIAKDAVKNLGANKTEKAIAQIGRAIGTIAPTLQQFDSITGVNKLSGTHHMASAEKDRNIIVGELLQSKVFNTIPGRKHRSFPHPRHVLHAKTLDELLTWMQSRLSSHHIF